MHVVLVVNTFIARLTVAEWWGFDSPKMLLPPVQGNLKLFKKKKKNQSACRILRNTSQIAHGTNVFNKLIDQFITYL